MSYFTQIFGTAGADLQARVSIWDGGTKKTAHIGPGEAEFDKVVQGLVANNHDVYVGLATRRTGLTGIQRGKIMDCRSLGCFWLDVDHFGGTHVAQNLPKTEDDLLFILSAGPDPTMIVDSGGGWHVYWCFDHVGISDTVQMSRITKAWQVPYLNKANSIGWHLDDTGNLDRVLRVPNTFNFKGAQPTAVRILTEAGPRYSFEQLAPAASAVRIQGSEGPVDSEADAAAPSPRPSGRVPADILSDLRKKLASVQQARSKTLAGKILKGQSFATPGQRDTELQRAASLIAFLEPDEDPKTLVQVLSPSIAHWQDVDSGTYTHESNLKWAAEKIERAQRKKRQERVGTEAVERALRTAARQAPRGANLPPPPDDPGASYTPEEIEAFATQQEQTVRDFRQRWIIQKDSAYWVYVNGRYQAPVSYQALQTCLFRELSPAEGVQGGVSLTTLDSKGQRRNKKTQEILDNHATVVRAWEATLSAPYSRYDADNQKFVEAVSPIRAIEPKFHPQIDHWLRLLGGPNADKLLDWIATVTNLDKQSSGLYLFGQKGTGKTMLAHGLARLWGTGGPTELDRVLGDWSADIARCPLIFADEHIPHTQGRTSADLRKLIGSSNRTLTRKYLPNADLTGAIRLILAANNFGMLMFNEVLNRQDLDAIAERFLFMKVDTAPSDYLKSISTAGWVDGDLIAQHALFLRESRKVNPGERFVVQGEENSWTRLLAVQGPVPQLVAEWLCRCLADNAQSTGPRKRGLVNIGNGQFYVNPQALLDFWELYVKNQRQPHSGSLTSALGNLSSGKVRHFNTWYWDVDVETLIAFSVEHLIASEDDMRENLEKPMYQVNGKAPKGPTETADTNFTVGEAAKS